MTTVCIQCAMRAFVKGEPSPLFEESPEEHRRRYHPDLLATRKERLELQDKLAKRMASATLEECRELNEKVNELLRDTDKNSG